jgi:hypothetical protein
MTDAGWDVHDRWCARRHACGCSSTRRFLSNRNRQPVVTQRPLVGALSWRSANVGRCARAWLPQPVTPARSHCRMGTYSAFHALSEHASNPPHLLLQTASRDVTGPVVSLPDASIKSPWVQRTTCKGTPLRWAIWTYPAFDPPDLPRSAWWTTSRYPPAFSLSPVINDDRASESCRLRRTTPALHRCE